MSLSITENVIGDRRDISISMLIPEQTMLMIDVTTLNINVIADADALHIIDSTR